MHTARTSTSSALYNHLRFIPFVMNSQALLIMIYNGYVFIAVGRLALINKY